MAEKGQQQLVHPEPSAPTAPAGSDAAGKGVFQRYKLARRDGLHWSYARCLQMPGRCFSGPVGKAAHRRSWSV